jgi:anti-sigma B factor antagonist
MSAKWTSGLYAQMLSVGDDSGYAYVRYRAYATRVRPALSLLWPKTEPLSSAAYSAERHHGSMLTARGQLIKRRRVNDPSPRVVRLQMSGEFDISNKDDLTATSLPAESADYVIIDMTGTTYIDSSALHCLIHLKRQLMARSGGAIQLVGVHPAVHKLFTITGLDDLFEISGQSEEL